MSRRVQKSARAEIDIRGIGRWIARDSLTAALKWGDDLDRKLRVIADLPGIGTDRSDLRPGLRSYPFGNYLIFFKAIRGGIVVVRVLHGARDYRRLFGKT